MLEIFVGKVAVCVHLNVFRFMCLILFQLNMRLFFRISYVILMIYA